MTKKKNKKDKIRKLRPTILQSRLIRNISENALADKPKTLVKVMQESGYTHSTSNQQSRILNSPVIRQELDSIVQQMVEHREEVINRMREIMPRAAYRNLVESMDKLTKNIQLLSGGKTDNQNITFSWEE